MWLLRLTVPWHSVLNCCSAGCCTLFNNLFNVASDVLTGCEVLYGLYSRPEYILGFSAGPAQRFTFNRFFQKQCNVFMGVLAAHTPVPKSALTAADYCC